jgi:hypothetical protein
VQSCQWVLAHFHIYRASSFLTSLSLSPSPLLTKHNWQEDCDQTDNGSTLKVCLYNTAVCLGFQTECSHASPLVLMIIKAPTGKLNILQSHKLIIC